jgi:steroid 5-alpha reductase family enzyme
MLFFIAILLAVAFIGWIIYTAAKRKQIKIYVDMYWLSSLVGVFTVAFFMTMDIPRMIKILVCIVLGAVFIFLAAYLQRRKQPKRRQASRS